MFGRGIQAPEIILILLVILLLFGARKLPDLARGVGRSLRIFKAETKGLSEDEKAEQAEKAANSTSPSPLEVEARRDDVPAPNVSEPVRDPVDNVTESPRRDV
jgi:sec-independent protein translocase protein TatA